MATSKLQRQVSILLSTHLGQYTIRENCRPEWLEGLELDFYIEELGIGIEVQGQQHFDYVPYFHESYENFLKLKERDERKADLCKHLGVPLHYIECPDDILPLIEQLGGITLDADVHPNALAQTLRVYIADNTGRKAKKDEVFLRYLSIVVGQERVHGVNEKAKLYAEKAVKRVAKHNLVLREKHCRILIRILTG
jgi:hypothetical protein